MVILGYETADLQLGQLRFNGGEQYRQHIPRPAVGSTFTGAAERGGWPDGQFCQPSLLSHCKNKQCKAAFAYARPQ